MHCGLQPRASLACRSRRPSRSACFRCTGTRHLRCCASPQDRCTLLLNPENAAGGSACNLCLQYTCSCRPDGNAAPSEPAQTPHQKAAQDPEAERTAGRQLGAQPVEDDELMMPLSDDTMDWREFRARLVAGSRQAEEPSANRRSAEGAREWAHPVTRPEKGCLLLAHPKMFADSQTYFNQASLWPGCVRLDWRHGACPGPILSKGRRLFRALEGTRYLSQSPLHPASARASAHLVKKVCHLPPVQHTCRVRAAVCRP